MFGDTGVLHGGHIQRLKHTPMGYGVTYYARMYLVPITKFGFMSLLGLCIIFVFLVFVPLNLKT